MPDWTKSMEQTFEYYKVDPESWNDICQLDCITSSTLTRDAESETLGSASLTLTSGVDEFYFRVYLVTIQNGIREREPLGTYLIQTPSRSFDGAVDNISADAYTPLLELKEKHPPIGFTLLKEMSGGSTLIMQQVSELAKEHMRAPVVAAKDISEQLPYNFTADTDDTWLSYLTDLLSAAKHRFGLDEYSRVIFERIVPLEGMHPVCTFDDSNSSILYADVTVSHDLYDIPNVIEVIYSDAENTFYATVKNTDKNSPTSIPARGREIVRRITNPSFAGTPSQQIINDYAKEQLKSLSKIVYTITYEHGYYPVRIGDCVCLNYAAAGIDNVNAVVKSQTITCEPGCKVSETAEFTQNLWEG